MDLKKLGKPLILLFCIIFLCSVVVRVFSGSDTLQEYAEKNPEIALKPIEKRQSPKQQPQTQASQKTDVSANNQTVSPPETDKKDVTAEDAGSDKQNAAATNSETDQSKSEDETMQPISERVEYKSGFYYEPLSDDIIRRITGISYPVRESEKDSLPIEPVNLVDEDTLLAVSYDDLRYVRLMYYNFKGNESTGELICHKSIAQDMVEIFYELHKNEYQIEQIRLIDEYSGDDTLSMKDNNTSCFNYRVVDGTDKLSKHAYGLAIDINPFFNPYVVFKGEEPPYISPPGSEVYADRSASFAYKIDENDLCYKLFTERGFTWGGNWNSMKDYQHFQKPLN